MTGLIEFGKARPCEGQDREDEAEEARAIERDEVLELVEAFLGVVEAAGDEGEEAMRGVEGEVHDLGPIKAGEAVFGIEEDGPTGGAEFFDDPPGALFFQAVVAEEEVEGLLAVPGGVHPGQGVAGMNGSGGRGRGGDARGRGGGDLFFWKRCAFSRVRRRPGHEGSPPGRARVRGVAWGCAGPCSCGRLLWHRRESLARLGSERDGG